MSVLLKASGLTIEVMGRALVQGIDLELRAGELTVLVGPNGSGKTTLLRALLGELESAAGQIELFGEPLHDYRALHRARLITLVPQEQPSDFPLRVGELVELGRLPHRDLDAGGDFKDRSARDRAAVGRALKLTGLIEFEDRDVRTLSGGERQRAALARALAQQTTILMLDEPTAHLDLAHQIATLEIVRERVEHGGAALIALHDLSLAARFGHQVVVLENGKVAARGRPADVFTRERLARSFGVETRVERDSSGEILSLTALSRVVLPVSPEREDAASC